MKYLKFFSILLIIPFALAFFPSDELKKEELVMQLLMRGIEGSHYDPKTIDNDFSLKVYDLYLERLDQGKRFLTQKEVDQLEVFKYQLDEQIKGNDFTFFKLSDKLLNQQIEKVNAFYAGLLEQPFDFTIDEEIEADADKMAYAANDTELKERWRKILKYQVVTRLATAVERQEKAQEKADSVIEIKTIAQLEENERERVLKSNTDYFSRLRKLEESDRFSTYMNAIVNINDPHTTFFPPKDKENFDISFSGRLEGIGATLQEKDGYIEVQRIVPGSASWRQGDLKVGHQIIKVAQGDEEPVDVVDMRLDNAVKLIRGKKGTEVRLTIKNLDGEIIEISIIRDIVVIDETYAKSIIIKRNDQGKRIGYIDLPSFYADFTRTGGKSCAEDVYAEINKLTEAGIDGMILDLRSNSGGSLNDVVKIGGYFIDEGPMVQVKDTKGFPMVLKDRDKGTLYDGPLVVMVNSFSASASEIMAGAMQDYKRAVILGSPSTFGKGSVQKFIDLDRMVRGGGTEELKPLGSLKITMQKFYRISGGTNQLKGVESDIVLPDLYKYIETGEKEYEYALAFDEIPKVNYQVWPLYNEKKFNNAIENSQKRIDKNDLFGLIDENATRLKENRDKSMVSLNLDKIIAERKQNKEDSKKFDVLNEEIEGLEILPLQASEATLAVDSIKKASTETWHKNLKKDLYLFEAINVVGDLN